MKKYKWDFPLTRTHMGMLLGNGTIGAMIWGEGNVLRITFGRADLWDHRGGMPITEKQNFVQIRKLLEKGDEKGLRKIFESCPVAEGEPARPSIIPVGRIDLEFSKKVVLKEGWLDLDNGVVELALGGVPGKKPLRISMDMDSPVVGVSLPPKVGAVNIQCVPSWDTVRDDLKDRSFVPPVRFGDKSLAGWVQEFPVDPSACVGYCKKGNEMFVAVCREEYNDRACAAAAENVSAAFGEGFAKFEKKVSAWWKKYWRQVPKLKIPNDSLSFLYEYGMYKFAGLANPTGVPATLQGPWVEDYQLPPWSNDYHFNINVQMCYWPAWQGNLPHFALPLLRLVDSWKEKLSGNAKMFVGVEDGLMLPHAVDDRCTCMGGFWTGTIDHACTAWVAQMMYTYYRYTMDEGFLRETAFPFMKGAMRVYEEMLEKKGKKYSLPVSVSPEYRGAAMNAWGKNASFQLAAIHMLLEMLDKACVALGEKPAPEWKKISNGLPKASVYKDEEGERIGLWDGTDLEESHRHHSHLAGITPFNVFDEEDPEWKETITRSMRHWIKQGPGWWSGWCMPWASMLHTRSGRADAAELTLEIWRKVFTNRGHGTRHDADFDGYTLIAPGRRPEIMQMDAGMGAVAAIMEMLLYHSRGVHYVFRGAPESWGDVSFKKILADGAFLVSASRKGGCVSEVKLKSKAGGVFRLKNPWSSAVKMKSASGDKKLSGDILFIHTEPGDSVTLSKA